MLELTVCFKMVSQIVTTFSQNITESGLKSFRFIHLREPIPNILQTQFGFSSCVSLSPGNLNVSLSCSQRRRITRWNQHRSLRGTNVDSYPCATYHPCHQERQSKATLKQSYHQEPRQVGWEQWITRGFLESCYQKFIVAAPRITNHCIFERRKHSNILLELSAGKRETHMTLDIHWVALLSKKPSPFPSLWNSTNVYIKGLGIETQVCSQLWNPGFPSKHI